MSRRTFKFGSSSSYAMRAFALLAASSFAFAVPRPVAADSEGRPLEAIAADFTALTTTSSLGQVQIAGKDRARLARWERPMTWAVLGRDVRPIGDYARLAVITLGGRLKLRSEGRISLSPVEPSALAPAGLRLQSSDLRLDKATSPRLGFQLDPKSHDKALSVAYQNTGVSAVVQANIILLVGDSGVLWKAAQSVHSIGAEIPTPDEFRASRCIALTWVGAGSEGLIASIIFVDDQVLSIEIPGCLVRPMGRVLGISGNVTGRTDSAFAADNAPNPVTWTAFDLSVAAMLYDPAFRSGMTADEVARIASRLVSKYFTDGRR